jgi:hypothetical protein
MFVTHSLILTTDRPTVKQENSKIAQAHDQSHPEDHSPIRKRQPMIYDKLHPKRPFTDTKCAGCDAPVSSGMPLDCCRYIDPCVSILCVDC